MRTSKFLFTILLAAAVSLLSGCASFRNSEIADAGKMPDVSQYKNKPSVFVEFHRFFGEPGSSAREIFVQKEKVQEKIGKSLDGTGLFSKYSFDEADRAKADYVLRVDLYNHGSMGLAVAAGVVTGLTLGVIPSAATDNYTLEVKLNDKGGSLLSKNSNKDSMTTWIGLWLIPVMGKTPEKAFTETLDNQLRTALKELYTTGKLKYSSLKLREQASAI